MRRRLILRWASVGSGLILGGSFLPAGRVGAETQEGQFPLLALADLKKPLPTHWITPNGLFYVQSYQLSPQVDASSWQLQLTGELEAPQQWSLPDIQAQSAEDFYWTLECIGNPAGGTLISNAQWRGTRLKPLLERARIRPAVREFVLRGADGYQTSVMRQELMHDDVWLAYQMNGEPLPLKHGFPVRIFIPGKYGQKQPKWLTHIEAAINPEKGHWEKLGWDNNAAIQTQALPRQLQSGQASRMLSNKMRRVTLPAGQVVLAGVALASLRPIDRIEVSIDGGSTWALAEQTQPPTPYEWTLWRWTKALSVGNYLCLARAVAGGQPQPLEDRSFFNGNQAVLRVEISVQ